MRRVLFLLLVVASVVRAQAVDPGPRGVTVGAGSPVAGLSVDQQAFFAAGLKQFNEVQDVLDPSPGNGGLGPAFNSNSCGSCHSQPAAGGTSPSVSAFPFIGPNPEIAVATLRGATNTVPPFITVDGPAREVRFKYVIGSGGRGFDGFGEFGRQADGGVHDLFTIAGRDDAAGCTLAQPDFTAQNNMIFRIPTPVFGLGMIENLSDATLIANLAATAQQRRALGIGGTFNHSGNDGTITRLGWKAQNKSLLIFAGEAYNVEIGVTNEAFPNERGNPPASCLFNATPEDTTIPGPVGSDPAQALSDIQDFELFMRFLDQPAPGPSSPSVVNGQAKFNAIGCVLCHTTSMITGPSFVTGLNQIAANLYSDLALHHMGENLEDDISQGQASGDQFRTAPLWGVGQRVFLLHDGRTKDLLQAIQAHHSSGSEANQVIRQFNALPQSDQQSILDFLRSL